VSPRRLSRTSLSSFSAEGADGFPTADALGSIRALYNPDGRPVFATTYDAYGTEGPYTTGENPIPYGFAGERSHPTGLYWLRARWYVPSYRPEGNQTTFTYHAVGNLISRSDPEGRVTRYPYDAMDRRVGGGEARRQSDRGPKRPLRRALGVPPVFAERSAVTQLMPFSHG
jgi:YD repeat-containing protein